MARKLQTHEWATPLITAVIQDRRLKTSFSPFWLFPQYANLPSQLTSAVCCTPFRLGSRQYPVLLIPGRFPYPAWHRWATLFHYNSFSALSIPFFFLDVPTTRNIVNGPGSSKIKSSILLAVMANQQWYKRQLSKLFTVANSHYQPSW